MTKYFTIDEANRSLALIRPIVNDIVVKMKEAHMLHDSVKCKREKENASESEMLAELNRASKLLNEVEYHMKELENVGVLLKDLTRGLVDFPHLYSNRVIYLCWMLGEETIEYWHEVNEGFEGRKKIDEKFIATFSHSMPQ